MSKGANSTLSCNPSLAWENPRARYRRARVRVLRAAVELLRVLTSDLWPWLAVGSVLYFSWHRYEHGRFWPFLRESDADAVGRGQGLGFTVNLPWNQVPTLKPQAPTQTPPSSPLPCPTVQDVAWDVLPGRDGKR